MKEIDFLPEWYKSGKRRQAGYRTQYVALGGIFIVMMVWNFVATRSISRAKAQLAQTAATQVQAENTSREFAILKTEIMSLQKKAGAIERIDSRIDVASVLAEMSFLIDKKISLSKIEFIAEPVMGGADRQGAQLNNSSVVRAVLSKFNEKDVPLGGVRFKVVICGIAADAGDVASLICKLEDSPYFCQVVPSFSRNARVKAANYPLLAYRADAGEKTEYAERDVRKPGTGVPVSEFEISCYLANYREQ
jgi:hypothetical protein